LYLGTANASNNNEILLQWKWKGEKPKYAAKKYSHSYENSIVDKFPITSITINSSKQYPSQVLSAFDVSPSGKAICYQVYNKKSMNLFYSILPSRKPVEINKNKFNSFDPCFISDNQIVLSTDKSGMPKLWIYDLNSKKMRQLTYGTSIDTMPHSDKYGRYVVFSSLLPGTNEWIISRINTDGSNLKYFRKGTQPRISPSGSKIAFLAEHPFDPNEKRNLIAICRSGPWTATEEMKNR
jgi:hypothetical protein